MRVNFIFQPLQELCIQVNLYIAYVIARGERPDPDASLDLDRRGRLAIYDVVDGNGQPPVFPVPWANRPELSFLLSANSMRTVLRAIGFHEVSWTDTTQTCLEWLVGLQPRLNSPAPLSLAIVMGPYYQNKIENLLQNLRDGRVQIVQTILRRQ